VIRDSDMLHARCQLGHSGKLQTCVIVFVDCRLGNILTWNQTDERFSECLGMRMINNVVFTFERNRHDFFEYLTMESDLA
jgi:hypothetical protein